MNKFSRKFGKYENTLFYADYGYHFIVWVSVLCLIGGVVYFGVFA